VNDETRHIAAWTTSGPQGRFALAIPRGRHRFSAVAPDYSLVRIEDPRPGRIRIVVQVQGHPRATSSADVVVIRGSADGHDPLEIVSGRVIDETRVGLPGVRLMLVAPDGRTVALVNTAADGAFEAAARPGPYKLLVFAPGLRLQPLEETARNQWRITLAVAGGIDTIRIEVAPTGDPENPNARERARLTFQGLKVNNLPRVSPTLADLQSSGIGALHPVALQPLGSFCIKTTHCDQRSGQAVCCASNGDLTDEYLSNGFGGIAGACRPAPQCPGARSRRR
jgi:hypothetical protein